MNQFYLYDKGEADAYNRARLKPVGGCKTGQTALFEFLIADDHSEVPTFVSNLL
jgi:hypothetical protein